MTRYEKLSYVADSLLSLVERDKSCPHYSEESFQRKLNLASQREKKQEILIPDPAVTYLLDKEWKQIIRDAKLTKTQLEVLMLKLRGWTFEAIGELRGHTKQGAQSIFSRASKKIRVAYCVYQHTGMSEIYRNETNRGWIKPR